MSAPLLPSTVLVYSGPGAGTRSVLSAVESLRRALRPTLLVDTIGYDDILAGDWAQRCKMLVMPGGADMPYCRHLNGTGNALIQRFMQQGGSYLGLCAGAYYGCSRVEFELGTAIEVAGDRELCFYPGIAQGSIYDGFDYQSERGAVAAPIRFKSLHTSDGWQDCRDYINGGPSFLYSQPSQANNNSNSNDNFPAVRLSPDSPQMHGVEILATFPEHDNAAAAVVCQVGLGRAVLCSTHPELTSDWLALPPGAGRSDAVLTSVDAEQETYRTHQDGDVSYTNEVFRIENHVAQLRQQLDNHRIGRWAFWNTLLVAAGLRDALVQDLNGPGSAQTAPCSSKS